jgi:metal-responsive CopG/Arc/MetJ family transcriptional regulator
MKVKTSITISKELAAEVDRFAQQLDFNRSEFIETAVGTYIAQLKRDAINARDVEIINREADRLNEEAADVLEYQALS